MENLFDLIGGLPLHPLTVHAAAVLIPLSAIALLLLVLVPKWRKTYMPLTIGSLGVSAVLAFVAKQSGEALAVRVGNPADHQALGNILFPAAVGLFALGLAFAVLSRATGPKWSLQLSGALAAVAVSGVVVLAVLVGHSGAQATWGNRVLAAQAQELPTPTETTPTTTENSGITVSDVQSHNSAADCWSVVDGNVYDLTSYISKHKGGAAVLTAICGKDGTKAFSGQHAGQPQPNSVLASFLVGPLAGSSAGAATDPAPEAAPASPATLTSAEVKKHNTGTDCWTVIKGQVYELTSYVNSHPGGANLIKAICGKDGSAAFSGQHAGASKLNNILAAFALGPLVVGGSLPEAAVTSEDDDD